MSSYVMGSQVLGELEEKHLYNLYKFTYKTEPPLDVTKKNKELLFNIISRQMLQVKDCDVCGGQCDPSSHLFHPSQFKENGIFRKNFGKKVPLANSNNKVAKQNIFLLSFSFIFLLNGFYMLLKSTPPASGITDQSLKIEHDTSSSVLNRLIRLPMCKGSLIDSTDQPSVNCVPQDQWYNTVKMYSEVAKLLQTHSYNQLCVKGTNNISLSFEQVLNHMSESKELKLGGTELKEIFQNFLLLVRENPDWHIALTSATPEQPFSHMMHTGLWRSKVCGYLHVMTWQCWFQDSLFQDFIDFSKTFYGWNSQRRNISSHIIDEYFYALAWPGPVWHVLALCGAAVICLIFWAWRKGADMPERQIKNRNNKGSISNHSYREKIVKQFHTLALYVYKQKLRDISNAEICSMKKNWRAITSCLLTFESPKVVNIIEENSFHKKSKIDNTQQVLGMLQIFTSYARMQVISFEEVHAAFDSFGITIFASALPCNDRNSEAILTITFPNKEYFFQNSFSCEEFRINLEEDIISSLKCPIAMRWIKDVLKVDDDITGLEMDSLFEEFPLDRVEIKVIHVYPGSYKCVVNVKFLDFPDNSNEKVALLKILRTVLENIEFVKKSKVDSEKDPNPNTLRLIVGTKNLKTKMAKEDFLTQFVQNIRKNLSSTNKEDLIKKLQTQENPLPPVSIGKLVDKLYEEDAVFIDVELFPKDKLNVDTNALKNIALWPRNSRKLNELPMKIRWNIGTIIDTYLPNNVCQQLVINLDKEDDDLNDIWTQSKNILSHESPYIKIIDCYAKKQGTIGGLISALQSCLNNERIKRELWKYQMNIEEVIEEIISKVNKLREELFGQLKSNFPHEICNEEYVNGMASYQDFKKSCSRKNVMEILKSYARKWDDLTSIVKEGDQIWMVRHNFGIKYAHVGVFVKGENGEYNMVHVSEGDSTGCGKIKEENVMSVILDSKCFIVRPDDKRKQNMSGEPMDRARACIGENFLYSAKEGSCEVFVNCVTQGIWTTDLGTIQGDEHPHVDRVITGISAVRNGRLKENQRKDMLRKIATCLYKKGYQDGNIVQHSYIQVDGQTLKENHEPITYNSSLHQEESGLDDQNSIQLAMSVASISNSGETLREEEDASISNPSTSPPLPAIIRDSRPKVINNLTIPQIAQVANEIYNYTINRNATKSEILADIKAAMAEQDACQTCGGGSCDPDGHQFQPNEYLLQVSSQE